MLKLFLARLLQSSFFLTKICFFGFPRGGFRSAAFHVLQLFFARLLQFGFLLAKFG
jgi:hypothetical protein